jgi:tRNA 2-selenouridine synthase
MVTRISINDYLGSDQLPVLLDVRTPAEFAQGHIPGALNLPLFSDEERVVVGTTYKQVGREEAILLGFDLAGPKWSGFIKQALVYAPDKKVAVHCWRGGMRSGAMAWALDLYGFQVSVIRDGYKSFRRWAHQQFEIGYRLCIVGGMTGSGKTKLLQAFRASGEQVIDLEDLAQHQGSAYGSMNQLVQPTQEAFENNLAYQLYHLDHSRRIWVEDESISIGKRAVPKTFWLRMSAAPLIELQVDTEQRIAALLQEYGTLDKEFLIAGTERIRKRLGPEQTKQAIAAIRDNRLADFIRIVLVYYDKTYRAGLQLRVPGSIYPITVNNNDIATEAGRILDQAAQIP